MPWEGCRDGRNVVRAMQANWNRQERRRWRLGFPYDIEGFGADSEGVLHVFTHARGYAHGRDILARWRLSIRWPAFAARGNSKLAAFIEECKRGPAIGRNSRRRRRRACRTGLTVRHPISGEAVPVWVGNYVLMSYGDGAVHGRARAR